MNEDNDVNGFINLFVTKLIEISTAASDILKEKYTDIYKKLNIVVDKKKKQDTKYKFKFLICQLDDFITQIPVLGFNSSKYDLNLIKNNLFDALLNK